jgi:hypothetical protein
MKLQRDSKITQGRFYEASGEQKMDGFNITLPDDIKRHLKIKGDNIFFTVINGVCQITGENPKTELPLFSPDDFEQPQK